MPNVYKHITRGSTFGQTEAVGDFERVCKCGIMPCGSGDDHTLSNEDRKLVAQHDPATGDLTLPPGPFSARKSPGPIKR